MAHWQNILLEEVTETQHQLLTIIHTSSMAKIALLINYALMETMWQAPTTILPTCRQSIIYLIKAWSFFFHTHNPTP